MSSNFVRTCITIYNRMDKETKNVYKRILNLPGNATIIQIEYALLDFERLKNNTKDFLADMEADSENK